MAPADEARDTIPRPVDLKAEVRTGLEDFLGSEAGYSEGRSYLKSYPLLFTPFHPSV